MSFVHLLAAVGGGYAAARGVDALRGGAAAEAAGAADPGLLDSLGLDEIPLGAGLLGLGAVAGGALAATTSLGDILSTPAGQTPLSPEAEEGARWQLRALVQLAKADGTLSPDERRRLFASAGGEGPQELTFLTRQLAAPFDPDALIAETPPEYREAVYRTVAAAMRPTVPSEAAFLARLAQGFELT